METKRGFIGVKLNKKILKDDAVKNLSDSAFRLFVYFIGNTDLYQIGLLVKSAADIARELGWYDRKFRRMKRELMDGGLIFSTRYYHFLPTYLRYHFPIRANVCRQFIFALDLLPENKKFRLNVIDHVMTELSKRPEVVTRTIPLRYQNILTRKRHGI